MQDKNPNTYPTMKKVILHIPHSSTVVPDKQGIIVDDEILNSEFIDRIRECS